MKTDCNIIKDLIPLYIDKVCSKKSSDLIEEHLKECNECRQYMDDMKDDIKVSGIDEKLTIKDFSKTIKRKRLVAIILSVIITLFVILIILNIFNRTEFSVKYEENLITAQRINESEYSINVNKENYTNCRLIIAQNLNNGIDVYINLTQTLRDKLNAPEIKGFSYVTNDFRNYVDENVDIKWVYENKKGKVILNTTNHVEVDNIYYIENKDNYAIMVNTDNDTINSKSAIKMEKIDIK